LTSITCYGGVAEIGGNKFLVEDLGTRVFLDFGMDFSRRRQFYSVFSRPKSCSDLIEFGVLPRMSGVYDYDNSSCDIDAVVLSHAHMDHFQCISLLKRDIEIYASEQTIQIIQAVMDTRREGIENSLSGLKFKTFYNGRPFKVGDIEIIPFEVDHSIPSAHSFILHTSKGPVAYSGDFRLHGRGVRLTRNFIAHAHKEKPLVLLCEGTNISEGDRNTERDVLKEASEIVGGSNNLVFAYFSAVDIDRLRSFYRVAEDTNRRLAISCKQAYVLGKLKNQKGIGSFLTKDILCVFKRKKRHYEKWERAVHSNFECVEAVDMKNEQNRWIKISTMYDLDEMLEIRPNPGSVFLFSASEPFNEEMEEDFSRLRNWLGHFGVPLYNVHSSGHMMPIDIRSAVSQMNPRKLIPIHTQSQGFYKTFLHDVVSEIVEPQLGHTYSLD